MQLGIHLPQYGRVASPDAITTAAQLAEELGFAGVWVSDHVMRPAAQSYPSPHLYEPLLTLGWAAAATETIGLGTSVMVVPQHHPLALANALASLDSLSAGRLTVGAGVGWSEAEFAALDQGFGDRGARTDESLRVLRACWADDPVSFTGEHYAFDDLLVRPKPAHPIPIWVGGTVEAAYRRAAELGDGYHAIGLDTDTVGPAVARMRALRPDEEFVISLRTGWDPQGMEPETIVEECRIFSDAGVQYVVAAPWRDNVADWLRSMELLADLVLS